MSIEQSPPPIGQTGIVELKPALIDAAAELLALSLEPRAIAGDLRAHCRTSLERLLAFPSARCFLASAASRWVGFAITYWGFSPSRASPVLVLQDLFVIPTARRAGVARTLLEHLDRIGRAAGATRVQLETDDDNVPAQRLYEGAGFELLQQKKVYMRFL